MSREWKIFLGGAAVKDRSMTTGHVSPLCARAFVYAFELWVGLAWWRACGSMRRSRHARGRGQEGRRRWGQW